MGLLGVRVGGGTRKHENCPSNSGCQSIDGFKDWKEIVTHIVAENDCKNFRFATIEPTQQPACSSLKCLQSSQNPVCEDFGFGKEARGVTPFCHIVMVLAAMPEWYLEPGRQARQLTTLITNETLWVGWVFLQAI